MVRNFLASGFIALLFIAANAVSGDTVAYSCARVKNVAADDVLWIRDCPHHTCTKVGFLRHDETAVDVWACDGKWCFIKKNGDFVGWSHSGYLEVDPVCESTQEPLSEEDWQDILGGCAIFGC